MTALTIVCAVIAAAMAYLGWELRAIRKVQQARKSARVSPVQAADYLDRVANRLTCSAAACG